MSRTKSITRPRKRAQPSAKNPPRARVEKSAFFEAPLRPAPAFPTDIIIAPPLGARARPAPAARDGAKESVSPRKTRVGQAKTKTSSQPPQGRKTAAGASVLASTKKRPKRPEHPATPPDEIRPLTPAAVISETPETAPLPRAAAIVPYRKNGPIDALGYWLRKQGRQISGLFKRPRPATVPKSAIIEINRLRLENLLLERRIEILLAERMPEAQ